MEARILIVDDDGDFIDYLKQIIVDELKKVHFFEAKNATDAVNLLKKEKIDLCISDIRMPSLSGFSLVSHIQENHPKVPVIVISGYVQKTEIEALKKVAAAFFGKPFDIEIFKKKIRELIKITLPGKNQQFS